MQKDAATVVTRIIQGICAKMRRLATCMAERNRNKVMSLLVHFGTVLVRDVHQPCSQSPFTVEYWFITNTANKFFFFVAGTNFSSPVSLVSSFAFTVHKRLEGNFPSERWPKLWSLHIHLFFFIPAKTMHTGLLSGSDRMPIILHMLVSYSSIVAVVYS